MINNFSFSNKLMSEKRKFEKKNFKEIKLLLMTAKNKLKN